jgi:DNA-binding NarL/FixJ family response regulator
MRSGEYRVVVAKRDCLAADSICRAATATGLIAPATICRSAKRTLEELREQPAELAILGLTFSDMDGIDLIATICRERIARRILVVSSRRDDIVLTHLRPGVINGFFQTETDDFRQLPAAIRRICDDGIYFSPVTRPAGPMLSQMFTTHQIRILSVLCALGSESEAAIALGLSEHTIHGHCQRIYAKLGTRRLSKLVVEVVRRGLLRITPDGIIRPGFDAKMP